MLFRHSFRAALAALLPLAAASGAEPQLTEEAFETTTFEATIPAGTDGSIAVRTCAACQLTLMPLTPQTKFRVGGTEVSLAELNDYLRGAGERMLVVLYDPRNRKITGLAVAGELPRRARR